MVQLDPLDAALETIYDTAIHPENWAALVSCLDQLPPAGTLRSHKLADAIQADKHIGEAITGIQQDGYGEYNFLAMHFKKALAVAKRIVELEKKNNAVLAVIDQLPIGVCLISPAKKIIDSNKIGLSLLRQFGLVDSQDSGQVTEDFNNRLQPVWMDKASIAECLNDNTNGNNQLIVHAAFNHSSNLLQEPHISLFMTDRRSLPVPVKIFRKQYQMTRLEAELSQLVVQGVSLEQIAAIKNKSKHTIRNYIKKILQKAGCNKQTELVSRVLNQNSVMLEYLSNGDNRVGIDTPFIPEALQTQFHVLADGRNLAYCVYGDNDGEPLFYLHSIFGSRFELAPNALKLAKKYRYKVITFDRPGYGRSDPCHDLSMATIAADIKGLAQRMDIERFTLVGSGVGGLIGLACSSLLFPQVKHCIMVGLGDKLNNDELKRVLPLYRLHMRVARDFPALIQPLMSLVIEGINKNPRKYFNYIGERMTENEKSLLTKTQFQNLFLYALSESSRQGSAAMAKDTRLFMQDWPFSVVDCETPVSLWSGDQDYFIPASSVQRLAVKLKYARHYLVKDAGQLIHYSHWEEILRQARKA